MSLGTHSGLLMASRANAWSGFAEVAASGEFRFMHDSDPSPSGTPIAPLS
jgi:hypothetical protein